MAIKYKLISELYDRTCNTVVANPQSWQKYLDSACRNYKLRFDEQLLIFAQRPDATAVLEIERWNTSFGRWVNKGAKEPVIMMRVIQLYIKQIHKERTVMRIDAINDADMGESCYLQCDIGERIFLTREEAEAKLAEMEKKDGR